MYQHTILFHCQVIFHCMGPPPFYSPIHQWMNIWNASIFSLLWQTLLWTSMCKILQEHVISILKVKLLGCITIFRFVSNCQGFFLKQKGYPILNSHQQCMRVLIFPHLTNTLFFTFWIIAILLDMALVYTSLMTTMSYSSAENISVTPTISQYLWGYLALTLLCSLEDKQPI